MHGVIVITGGIPSRKRGEEVNDDDEITCDAGEGLDPVIVKLRSNQRLKVKSFPSELCGAGVSAQGTYKKAQ